MYLSPLRGLGLIGEMSCGAMRRVEDASSARSARARAMWEDRSSNGRNKSVRIARLPGSSSHSVLNTHKGRPGDSGSSLERVESRRGSDSLLMINCNRDL